MHAVRTKRGNYNVQDQKKGQRLITKEAKLKGKRKLNTPYSKMATARDDLGRVA